MKTFQKDPYGLFKKICSEENQMNPNQTKTDTTTGLKTCDGIKKLTLNAGTIYCPPDQTPERDFVTVTDIQHLNWH